MPQITAIPKQNAKNDRITGNALGDTVVLLCEKGGAA